MVDAVVRSQRLEHEELTERIIGCAYAVYNKLGHGFLESVYNNSMMVELQRAGLKAVSQAPIDVFYEGVLVGQFLADILVENTVIVELKAVRALVATHEVQLVNHLTATGISIGLLINFGEKSVEVRRKVRTLKVQNPVNPVNPV